MSDDKKKVARDRRRIALGEDYEVRYWAHKFGVSRERLAEAVREVGDRAEAVENHLRGNNEKGRRKGR